QHDVDERRHVDLGDDAAAAADVPARHQAAFFFRNASTSCAAASAAFADASTWRVNALYAATAGSATSRPTPVATSASAMPDITADVPCSVEPARSWNARMMPSTVPNRPMNGALLPSVPRNASRFS